MRFRDLPTKLSAGLTSISFITDESNRKFRKIISESCAPFHFALDIFAKNTNLFFRFLKIFKNTGFNMSLISSKSRWRRLPKPYLKEPPFKMCGCRSDTAFFNPHLKIQNPLNFSTKNHSHFHNALPTSPHLPFNPGQLRAFSLVLTRFNRQMLIDFEPNHRRFHVI